MYEMNAILDGTTMCFHTLLSGRKAIDQVHLDSLPSIIFYSTIHPASKSAPSLHIHNHTAQDAHVSDSAALVSIASRLQSTFACMYRCIAAIHDIETYPHFFSALLAPTCAKLSFSVVLMVSFVSFGNLRHY